MREIEQLLIVGVGVDRRHPPLLDAERLVQHLRQRGEAVGRARRVRDDLVLRGIVLLVVDAEHDRHVGFLGGRGDDDSFRARGDVLRGRVAIGEEAGRFEDDVDAEILPRQLRRIADRQHLELVAADRDRVVFRRDVRVQIAEHRVVFEKMRERLGAGEIVDGDEVDVLVAERRAHDVPADAAEPVDTYPDWHRHPPGQTFHSTISRSACISPTAC